MIFCLNRLLRMEIINNPIFINITRKFDTNSIIEYIQTVNLVSYK